MFFASLLAMAAAAVFFGIFVIILLTGLSSLSKPMPMVVDGSVLVFDMSMSVQDRPVSSTGEEFFNEAMGRNGDAKVSLYALKRGIEKAATDSSIKGLLLTGSFHSDGYSSGFAALKEVREAVEAFKESGKPVWAYLVYPSSKDLYVASAADTIYMNPEGVIADLGMSMGNVYLGGFMKKYGIGVQVTRAGEYKAAAESFVLEGMSEPAREANTAVLEDIWAHYLNTLSAARGFAPEAYAAKLDEVGMLMASDALELGLVDELAFSNKVVETLQGISGKDEEGVSFKQTGVSDYLRAKIHPEYSRDGFVAVIYAEGSIVAGEGDEDQVGSGRYVREIRKARLDDKVKAIVLRVNSPGGSALASEEIQHELRLAQESKPVVVSMGALAASGGYWISAYADKIYAQPNTLTGSIGVIGVFFNYEEIAGKHGVNFDSVKMTKHADLMGSFREKTDEEMALVQRQVDVVYESFLSKVAEGRGLEVDAVRAIAGGRIWSGVDALDLGLVDELGGLEDAIAYAAEEGGLGVTPKVKELPEPRDFFQELMNDLSHSEAQAAMPLMKPLMSTYEELTKVAKDYNDPRGVYSVLPYAVEIK